MKVTVFYEDGRVKYLDLVHEILERPDDIAITYTDLSDNTYKSVNVKLVECKRIGVKL